MIWLIHLAVFGAGVVVTLLGLYFWWCGMVWDKRHAYWLEGFIEGQQAERSWWTNQGKKLRHPDERPDALR